MTCHTTKSTSRPLSVGGVWRSVWFHTSPNLHGPPVYCQWSERKNFEIISHSIFIQYTHTVLMSSMKCSTITSWKISGGFGVVRYENRCSWNSWWHRVFLWGWGRLTEVVISWRKDKDRCIQLAHHMPRWQQHLRYVMSVIFIWSIINNEASRIVVMSFWDVWHAHSLSIRWWHS